MSIAPTYEEIKAAGLSLTDLQLYSIYGFMQTGVNALANFRTGQRGKSGAIRMAELYQKRPSEISGAR